MSGGKPIYLTLGFKCVDQKAFDAFWKEIRTTYKFCEENGGDVQCYAVNIGDMFATDEALTEILNSELTDDEKVSAIRDLNGHPDPAAVLKEWDITPFWEKFDD